MSYLRRLEYLNKILENESLEKYFGISQNFKITINSSDDKKIILSILYFSHNEFLKIKNLPFEINSVINSYLYNKMEMNMVNKMSKMLIVAIRNSMEEIVIKLGEKYKFDSEEAMIDIEIIMRNEKKRKEKKEKKIAMPFSKKNDINCEALMRNQGLYTQCENVKTGEKYCELCTKEMEKNSGKCEFGTISDRLCCGLMDYIDPKGKKVISYLKIMKKQNLTREDVEKEASKLGLTIDEIHFTEPEKKSGRPKKMRIEKKETDKPKKTKGRPKKSLKVLELEHETTDLFAELLASNTNDEDEEDTESTISDKENSALREAEKKSKEEAKEAEKKSKEAEKKAKEEAKEAEKKAKEEAKEAEKKAKEEAKEAEKKAKEAEKKSKEEAKEAEKKSKEEAKEAEKKAKEAEKKSKEEAKESEKKSKEVGKKANETEKKKKDESDEQDVVKKIEFEGVKYYKSKKTGLIYDLEQEVVGKWNEEKQTIIFEKAEDLEEEEEEYESDDDE
jgi:hypothetical protein